MTSRSDASAPPLVVFAGGGTGGHLYPALATAEALQSRRPEVEVVFWVTDRAGDREVLEHHGVAFVAQSLPAPGKTPRRWVTFWRALRRARRACRAAFLDRRPAAVIGSGGLASVPALLEARRLGIPAVLFNPDALPGRANRFLARYVDRVWVQWEDCRAHFSDKVDVRVTGCPVRPEFARVDADATSRAPHERFDLDPARRTLLVTGASQGARTLNLAILENLSWIREFSDWQVLHLTGPRDYDQVVHAHGDAGVRGRVLPFTHDMGAALRAADVVVSRAGASTLAEITALGKASILLPYPYHRDMHQLANARVLVRAGAARLVRDALDPKLNGPALADPLQTLMRDSIAREALADAARRIGRADAAQRVADQVVDLAGLISPASEPASR